MILLLVTGASPLPHRPKIPVGDYKNCGGSPSGPKVRMSVAFHKQFNLLTCLEDAGLAAGA
jgi:hypothetical protein